MDINTIKILGKKHWLSLSCAAVAVVAVVLAFWPLSSLKAELSGELNSRTKVFDTLKGLQSKQRKLPALDVNKPAQAPLAGFPGDQIITWGKQKLADLHREAQETINAAIKLDQEDLLLPKSLPTPGDNEKFTFRRIYPEAVRNNLPKLAESGIPPTEREINAAQDALWREQYQPRVLIVNGKPVQAIEEQLRSAYQAESLEVPQRLGLQRAQQIKVYMDPGVFQPSDAIKPDAIPAATGIWNAQYRYWVQQKVAEAIAGANASAKNVLDAPLKRVLNLSIDSNPIGSKVPRDFAVSPTGRVTSGNSPYEVYHFNMDVVVSLDRIPEFFENLSSGRFVTVTEVSQISAYDPAPDQDGGYVYGEEPLARMALTCELLMFKKWMAPFKPKG